VPEAELPTLKLVGMEIQIKLKASDLNISKSHNLSLIKVSKIIEKEFRKTGYHKVFVLSDRFIDVNASKTNLNSESSYGGIGVSCLLSLNMLHKGTLTSDET